MNRVLGFYLCLVRSSFLSFCVFLHQFGCGFHGLQIGFLNGREGVALVFAVFGGSFLQGLRMTYRARPIEQRSVARGEHRIQLAMPMSFKAGSSPENVVSPIKGLSASARS